MNKTQSTINGQARKTPLHYRLTNDEWLAMTNDLKYAEVRVLYHLRTIDPFGDRDIFIKIADLGQVLGLHKTTVGKALKVLDQKGYAVLDITETNVRLQSIGLSPKANEPPTDYKPPTDYEVPTGNRLPTNYRLPVDSDRSLQTSIEAYRLHPEPTGYDRRPEPLPEADPGSPHTLKTIQTNTHSVGEENFDFQRIPLEQEQEKETLMRDSIDDLKSKMKDLNFTTDTAKDKYAAPPARDPIENQPPADPEPQPCVEAVISEQDSGGQASPEHPVETLDRPIRNPVPIPIYRDGPGPNQIKDEFVRYIQDWMGTLPPQRERSRADALAYVRNQERSGDLTIINTRAQDWQDQVSREKANQRVRELSGLMLEAPAPECLDLSEVLLGIDINCRRLKWTREDAIAHMVTHHHWPSDSPAVKRRAFDLLLDADIIQMLDALKQVKSDG